MCLVILSENLVKFRVRLITVCAAVRKNKIITGLPDTYGRGRIVGDYRRVALYGIDMLIAKKQEDFVECQSESMFEDEIRQREEITMQINALKEMKTMAESYGFDISKPAKDAREACSYQNTERCCNECW